MDCTVWVCLVHSTKPMSPKLVLFFFLLFNLWEPSYQWAIPGGNSVFMKQNEQLKSKCHWEAKIQWCKCEIFLNLGMTNCINCNISESLLEIWAVMGNKCLLSRTGPCKWSTDDGTGWGTVLRDVYVLVCEWVDRPVAYRHATHPSSI